ncbi:DUF2878 domain-containing protein [candidate division KSB1 bacterium]
MKYHKLKMTFNVIGFKLSWVACVLGAVAGYSYVGPVLMAAYVIINTRLFGFQRSEILFLLFAAVIGTVIDSLKSSTGFITYTGGYANISWIAPLWITALWLGFAATLNHSLGWLRDNTILAFVIGAVFGPLAYIGGSKIGGITLNFPIPVTVFVLSLIWGTIMPSFYLLSKKLRTVRV